MTLCDPAVERLNQQGLDGHAPSETEAASANQQQSSGHEADQGSRGQSVEAGQDACAPQQSPQTMRPLSDWLSQLQQHISPEIELEAGSAELLETLLDNITCRVLSEAHQVASAESEEQLLDDMLVHKKRQTLTLTSLQIQKALRRVLPGEPGQLLRPYLPTATKHAWHLDKQSLRGVKNSLKKHKGDAGDVKD